MDQTQKVFIIGIFKGLASNATDPDVQYALGEAINIFGKLAQGYEIKAPEKESETTEE